MRHDHPHQLSSFTYVETHIMTLSFNHEKIVALLLQDSSPSSRHGQAVPIDSPAVNLVTLSLLGQTLSSVVCATAIGF